MLNEEQVTSYIDGLIRLGVLHKVPGKDEDELIRFKVDADRLMGRIFSGEFGEPPEGVDVVAWFSCILLKILLEEKDLAVSKEEFTGMAAVIMGFISEAAVMRMLHTDYDRPVISQTRPKKKSG
jgi:hypothetical protein